MEGDVTTQVALQELARRARAAYQPGEGAWRRSTYPWAPRARRRMRPRVRGGVQGDVQQSRPSIDDVARAIGTRMLTATSVPASRSSTRRSLTTPGSASPRLNMIPVSGFGTVHDSLMRGVPRSDRRGRSGAPLDYVRVGRRLRGIGDAASVTPRLSSQVKSGWVNVQPVAQSPAASAWSALPSRGGDVHRIHRRPMAPIGRAEIEDPVVREAQREPAAAAAVSRAALSRPERIGRSRISASSDPWHGVTGGFGGSGASPHVMEQTVRSQDLERWIDRYVADAVRFSGIGGTGPDPRIAPPFSGVLPLA